MEILLCVAIGIEAVVLYKPFCFSDKRKKNRLRRGENVEGPSCHRHRKLTLSMSVTVQCFIFIFFQRKHHELIDMRHFSVIVLFTVRRNETREKIQTKA